MPVKHKLFYFAAVLHLFMVALFAAHFGDWNPWENKVSKAITTVGDYTGSNNIFSFFAPELSDQPYVVYAARDSSGKERMIDLKGKSPDFTNRLNNIYGFMTLDEGRDVFASSLARFVSRNYAGAEKIRVAMVVQKIPDMRAYRAGERNKWKFWFDRDFQRNQSSNTQ